MSENGVTAEVIQAAAFLIAAEAQCKSLEDVPEEIAKGYHLAWRGSTITYLRDLLQAIDRAADEMRSNR